MKDNLDCPEETGHAVAYWDVLPRRLVAVSMSFALGTGLFLYGVSPVFMILFLLCFVLGGLFSRKRSLLFCAALFYVVGILNGACRLPRPGPADVSNFCGRYVLLSGRVDDLSVLASGRGFRLLLDCKSAALQSAYARSEETLPVTGKMQICVFQAGSQQQIPLRKIPAVRPVQPALDEKVLPFSKGDYILLRCRPVKVGSSGTERDRGLQAFLLRKAVFCRSNITQSNIVSVTPGKVESESVLESLADSWRREIVAAHLKNLGHEDGSLLASMVLGDRAVKLSREIKETFRACGLTQILVASGFNLTVVCASIYFALRFFCGRLLIINTVCFAGMLVFVALAGPSPSVLRAFLMGSFLLLSRLHCRTPHLPALLSLTMLLVLFFDPCSITDIGFQFSYLCTAGLIIAAGQFTYLLQRLPLRLPAWLNGLIVATLVAQACVLPLQIYYFRQFNPYCLLANLVVAPVVPFVTVLGFASSFLFGLESVFHCPHWLSASLDSLCSLPLLSIRHCVSFMASFPCAEAHTGQAQPGMLFFYYILLMLFPLFKSFGKLKIWSLSYAFSLFSVFCSVAKA